MPAVGEADTPASDAELASALRGGDPWAFERLFRREYGPLVGFAVGLIGDRPRAEEVVQDVFSTLWSERARLTIGSSVRGYLFAAVRHRALNLRRRDRLEAAWVAGETRASAGAHDRSADHAAAALDTATLEARVSAAFARLPERCRLVMQLRWREELSYAEIAEALGISIKGVENQLARGLKALRMMVRPAAPPPAPDPALPPWRPPMSAGRGDSAPPRVVTVGPDPQPDA